MKRYMHKGHWSLTERCEPGFCDRIFTAEEVARIGGLFFASRTA